MAQTRIFCTVGAQERKRHLLWSLLLGSIGRWITRGGVGKTSETADRNPGKVFGQAVIFRCAVRVALSELGTLHHFAPVGTCYDGTVPPVTDDPAWGSLRLEIKA